MTVVAFTPGSPLPYMAGLMAVGLAISFLMLARAYKRCPAGKVLVITGKTETGRPICLQGGAAFVWPLVQQSAFLDLAPMPVSLAINEVAAAGGQPLSVAATGSVMISTRPDVLEMAAQRLTGLSPERIQAQAQELLAGNVRQAAAGMSAEQISQNASSLAEEVRKLASPQLEQLGLDLAQLTITEVKPA